MFGIIAAQQPRPARPDRHPARQRRRHRVAEALRAGKAEIVVGGKIQPGARLQAAEPSGGVERLQVVQMRFEESHGARYSEAAG
ncbi:hypothetical protein D9M73_117290 [compost metagenome]